MEPPAFETNQDTKGSFIPYGSNKGQEVKEEQDVHFFKKHLQTPESSKEE
jgi:hypothetical protein